MNWRRNAAKTLLAVGLVLVLGLNLASCGGGTPPIPSSRTSGTGKLAGRLSEAAPSEVIQALKRELDGYQPQIKILSPPPNEVLQDNRVSVQLQVQDLPVFQDEELKLGPHVHLILDNQPYRAVFTPNEPIVLDDLSPGTHTLRAFASRPWHESFKNEGAYAQVTFHIFTKTPDNNPAPNTPLLTYSRPRGDYGAEPILLDFYLTNAPLHLIAQESATDDVLDWRIRITVNGESFVTDRWEPIYLKGFKPGKNWVQVELLDENGNLFPNPYNNTVRLINYQPGGNDPLSKLIRDELTIAEARGIIDPNYEPEIAPEPEPSPIPDISPFPEPLPTPSVTRTPEPVPVPTPDLITPELLPEPETDEVPEPVQQPSDLEVEPTPEPSPDLKATPQPAAPKRGLFDRFRRPAPSVVEPTLPDVIESPAIEAPVPEVEASPLPEAEPPAVEESPRVEETPDTEPLPQPMPFAEPQPKEAPASRPGFFNRFQRRFAPPKAVEPPVIEPSTPEVEEAPIPEETPTVEVPVVEPSPQPSIEEPPALAAPKRGFFDRFRRSTPSVEQPTIPDVLEPPATESPAPVEEQILPDEPELNEPEVEPTLEPEPTPPRSEEPTVVPSPTSKPGLFDRLRGVLPFNRPPAPVPSETIEPIPDELESAQDAGSAVGSSPEPEQLSEPEPESEPNLEPSPAVPGIVDRFRRRNEGTPPVTEPSPTGILPLAPAKSSLENEQEAQPLPAETRVQEEANDTSVPAPESSSQETPIESPSPAAPLRGLFDRFRRPPQPIDALPSPQPVPDLLEAPAVGSDIPDSEPSQKPEPSNSDDAVVAPAPEPVMSPSASPSNGVKGFFDRFRPPVSTEPLRPEDTLPEIVEGLPSPDVEVPDVEELELPDEIPQSSAPSEDETMTGIIPLPQ